MVRSFERGNGLFGVRVHGIRDLQKNLGVAGQNPFEYLAYRVADNRVYWHERNGSTWQAYDRVPSMKLSDVAYDLKNQRYHTFNCLFPVYDWVTQDGYNNIKHWVQASAAQAGK